jgi:hypothetical protein
LCIIGKPLRVSLYCPDTSEFNGAQQGRHLLTLCPLILSVFLDRIYPSGIIFEFHGAGRINWMFFLFSLSGRKGERESACGGKKPSWSGLRDEGVVARVEDGSMLGILFF